MFRLLNVSRLLLPLCLAFSLGLVGACSTKPASEPASEPAPDASNNTPDQAVVETGPEKSGPPAGVGQECVVGPRGDNCPTGLKCVTISSNKGICFENCTDTDTCADANEICRPTASTFKVCYKLAKVGEECDLNKRLDCRGQSADPPELCIEGKCKARPKDGWDEGESCSPPGSDEQSDCKAGLSCISIAKGLFNCLKKCTQHSDCPSGKQCYGVCPEKDKPCWEGLDQGQRRVYEQNICVTPAKSGESCDRLKLSACYHDDPNRPVACDSGKCTSTRDVKVVGEECSQSFDPTNKQGNCDVGLLCLGVAHFKSVCHKACNGNSDCPSGEVCATHPNDDKPIKACVIPVKLSEVCNLVNRRMCMGTSSQILRCKPKAENDPEGTCIEVKVGDACEGPADCGPMACLAVDGEAQKKYCLQRCNPQNPNCPGNGACAKAGNEQVCLPTGPKKEDEACVTLRSGDGPLSTSGLCVGGLSCFPFKKAEGSDPNGVCLERVAQCPATCKTAGHICIPLQNGGAICALDCSTNASVCKPGTTCIAAGSSKVCGMSQ